MQLLVTITDYLVLEIKQHCFDYISISTTLVIILERTKHSNNMWNFYQVVGTQGYAAPEYVQTGRLRVQSDIWSFGVVLYEILTGRRALNRNRPIGEQKLVEWVKNYPANSSRFNTIIDPRLRNQYSLGTARKVVNLADWCLKKNPEERPSMSQIVESLKQALKDSQTQNTSPNMTSKSTQSRLVSTSK